MSEQTPSKYALRSHKASLAHTLVNEDEEHDHDGLGEYRIGTQIKQNHDAHEGFAQYPQAVAVYSPQVRHMCSTACSFVQHAQRYRT